MKWMKPSKRLIDIFEVLIPKESGVEKRKMFGYPCCFFNGNMFLGLHQNNMFLRLSIRDREEFFKIEGARQFEPMPGRIMKEYVIPPPDMLNNSSFINKWIKRSLVYVSALPPKEKKKEIK